MKGPKKPPVKGMLMKVDIKMNAPKGKPDKGMPMDNNKMIGKALIMKPKKGK